MLIQVFKMYPEAAVFESVENRRCLKMEFIK